MDITLTEDQLQTRIQEHHGFIEAFQKQINDGEKKDDPTKRKKRTGPGKPIEKSE